MLNEVIVERYAKAAHNKIAMMLGHGTKIVHIVRRFKHASAGKAMMVHDASKTVSPERVLFQLLFRYSHTHQTNGAM